MIKVRFAPSPTGYLHVGGARTALFNWMYAKAQGGKFVLRIENTDLERSKPEYVDSILESMKWLGLTWDELYRQSDRFDIYREHAEKLLAEGKAYKEGDAVILNMPKEEIKIYDLIRGEIVFDSDALKDQVLMKSDGSPTYSFACVVDDALMEISHVIRGEDHIPNTPKQIVIYQSLGFAIPKYAHLPLIMDAEGGRMSKRTGAVAVNEYKSMGILSEALVNYLMLLGWSPGNNQEIISLKKAVTKFSIKKINKAAAAFSLEKLKWMNGQYIKQMDTAPLAEQVAAFLKAQDLDGKECDQNKIKEIVGLYKSRMTTFVEFCERTKYFFRDEIEIVPSMRDKFLSKGQEQAFHILQERLGRLDEYNMETAEKAFRDVVQELEMKASDLVHPVRVALTGQDVGPGLFETMAVLGKEKTVARLRNAVQN